MLSVMAGPDELDRRRFHEPATTLPLHAGVRGLRVAFIPTSTAAVIPTWRVVRAAARVFETSGAR